VAARLLCVGKTPYLLESRCAVLTHSGYEAHAATLSEAEILVRTEQYDLVIVSAWLSEWDRERILSSRKNTYLRPAWTHLCSRTAESS
jgi:DNA-binding response OmpR family regulator